MTASLPTRRPRVLFTADPHWGNAAILEYQSARGALWRTVEEMDRGLIDRWNAVVEPGDLVYCLGDVFLCKPDRALEILDQLQGQMYVIRGNHDSICENGRVRKKLAGLETRKVLWVPDPEAPGGKRRLVLDHHALRTWEGSHLGAWQLFGHSHGGLKVHPAVPQMDVGMDVWDFRPIEYDQVKAVLRHRDRDLSLRGGLRRGGRALGGRLRDLAGTWRRVRGLKRLPSRDQLLAESPGHSYRPRYEEYCRERVVEIVGGAAYTTRTSPYEVPTSLTFYQDEGRGVFWALLTYQSEGPLEWIGDPAKVVAAVDQNSGRLCGVGFPLEWVGERTFSGFWRPLAEVYGPVLRHHRKGNPVCLEVLQRHLKRILTDPRERLRCAS